MQNFFKIVAAAACCIAAAALVVPRGAVAQQGSNPFAALADALKLHTEAPDPAPFVKASRPAVEPAYLPFAPANKAPAGKVLTPDEIRAEEADLQSLRLKHDRSARRKPAPLMQSSAAPVPQAPKHSDNFHCVMTCTIK